MQAAINSNLPGRWLSSRSAAQPSQSVEWTDSIVSNETFWWTYETPSKLKKKVCHWILWFEIRKSDRPTLLRYCLKHPEQHASVFSFTRQKDTAVTSIPLFFTFYRTLFALRAFLLVHLTWCTSRRPSFTALIAVWIEHVVLHVLTEPYQMYPRATVFAFLSIN